MYYTMLERLVRQFDESEREFTFKAQTIEEHEKWKTDFRKRLIEISGIDRCQACETPRHEFIRTDDIEGFAAEYHILESEPEIFVPYYLIRPENIEGKHPIIFIPHGHGSGKDGTIRGSRQFIEDCLKAGFIVICPDERGCGDRREVFEQGDTAEKMRANSHRELLQAGIGFGRTVIGMAVWDLMKMADFLLSQPFCDGFLACAGMSGGGQQTLWFAALDERVRAAMTSGYFYGYKESLIELAQNCACNYVPHLFETADMGDIAALIAPRPLFVESGRQDPLSGRSGIDNVLPQIETAGRAYRLYGINDLPKHSIHDGGHQWVAKGVTEFILKEYRRFSS